MNLRQIIKTRFDLEGKFFGAVNDDSGVRFILGAHRIANDVKKLLKSNEIVKIIIGMEAGEQFERKDVGGYRDQKQTQQMDYPARAADFEAGWIVHTF